jgi:hypothetical protein
MPAPRQNELSVGSGDPEFQYLFAFLRWLHRRLLRLALRPYFGWTMVLALGTVLAIAGYLIVLHTGSDFGFYVLMSAWLCLGVLFGLLRRSLKHPQPSWEGLSAFGRIGRILVTACGTALFLAPFLWIAWKVAAAR